MKVRDRFGIDTRRQRQLTRIMQLTLVGLVFVGFDRGEFPIVVNAGIALGITYLPAILERDYHIPMDTGLTLWITAAVFLHALGTGFPGVDGGLYGAIPGWDHITHTLSASVVAAAGYATARAFHEHSDEVHLPPQFMFVFILLFVLAFGVFWEVIEFGIGGVASLLGTDKVLTQHGIRDTMLDLIFNTVGGVIVAIWGTAHLSDVVSALSARFDRSEA